MRDFAKAFEHLGNMDAEVDARLAAARPRKMSKGETFFPMDPIRAYAYDEREDYVNANRPRLEAEADAREEAQRIAAGLLHQMRPAPLTERGLREQSAEQGPQQVAEGDLGAAWKNSLAGKVAGDVVGKIEKGLQGDASPEVVTSLVGDLLIGNTVGKVGGAVLGANRMTPKARKMAAALKTYADNFGGTGLAPPDLRGVPSISNISADDAGRIASADRHLFPIPNEEGGGFVGGPPGVLRRNDVTTMRRRVGNELNDNNRGADWYDRTRNDIDSVTGSAEEATWMAHHQAQASAGVSPEAELAFALRETNSNIAGMPDVGHYPQQHEAHQRALASGDLSNYNSAADRPGDAEALKVAKYRREIDPTHPAGSTGTGTNDFRAATDWGYNNEGTYGVSEHKFMDYETARMTKWANENRIGGRTNWSGEQVQAALWVRQKTLAILEQRPTFLREAQKAYPNDPAKAQQVAYDEAFKVANTTIGSFFDKHAANATYEPRPGAALVRTGHQPGMANASPAMIDDFSNDPRSNMATAPGGRDAYYSGLGVPGTGSRMRVQPTEEMQGMFVNHLGQLELNPGAAAHPLVAFRPGAKGRQIAPADLELLKTTETVRSALAGQNAGAAHINHDPSAIKHTTGAFFPLGRKMTNSEMVNALKIAKARGKGDVLDTGRGITVADFMGPDRALTKPEMSGMQADMKALMPDAQAGRQVRTESIYEDLSKDWLKGEGSGAITRRVLDKVMQTPEMKAAWNEHPYLAQTALNFMERDASTKWTKAVGNPRADLQNLRKIVGGGPGWVDRLDAALKAGSVSLPAAALLYATVDQQGGR